MNLIRFKNPILCNLRTACKTLPFVRSAVLDKDWCPGPYPRTEEERLAAAKKYNLFPEEYEAIDPDKWEHSYGDYPKLPNRCYYDKDPWYNWDYLNIRKDFGDPVHIHENMYGVWGVRLSKHPVPGLEIAWWKGMLFFIFMYATGRLVLWFNTTFDWVNAVKSKHSPEPGVVHYHYPSSNIHVY